MKLITVNFRPVSVPEDATGAIIKVAALAAGIEPSKWGKGGEIQLRGYIGGGATLIKDKEKPLSVGISGGGSKLYKIKEFGLRDAEKLVSNRLGRGRSGYWPAKEGRLNHHQIRAAVLKEHRGNSRMWPMQLVLAAPTSFKTEGFPLEWDTDETGTIIQNYAGTQYDNWLTLPEAQGRKLIRLMIDHADQRRARWAAARPTKPRPAYQRPSGPSDKRSVRLQLLGRRGVFQKVDITKTLTPHGLSKLTVVHRHPKILRVFWHPGQAKSMYQVEGVAVFLVEKYGRYYEGTPSAQDWERLGVENG